MTEQPLKKTAHRQQQTPTQRQSRGTEEYWFNQMKWELTHNFRKVSGHTLAGFLVRLLGRNLNTEWPELALELVCCTMW